MTRLGFVAAILVAFFAFVGQALAQAAQLPLGEQCFSALAPTSGGTGGTGTGYIGLLGTITGGTGGTSGTYSTALTGGSGSGAQANITVSGGAVTAVAVYNPGVGYVVGDTLSATAGNIGGVTAFSVPVSSVAVNQALAGGSVGYYIPNTLTTSTTWKNSTETIQNTNPITLDANGCAIVYGSGTYRQIVKDINGNIVWDQLTSSVAAGFSPITPDQFGPVDRTGGTDAGGLINSAISSAKSCQQTPGGGNAVVYLRAGTYLITTAIIPKSCVTIVGDGRGKTVLLTNNSAPFAQSSGSQLVHFILHGVTFKDSGSHPSSTVMSFTAIQGSVIDNIGFLGYTSGTLMSIAGATVTTFDDTSSIFNNSNSIFNTFRDWVAENGCANCIQEAGAYGSTPTASPANSSNVPSIVVTQNVFDNINLWNCSGKCIDLIKAVDTEVYRHVGVFMNSNSAVAVQVGDDNANFPGNNYVNSHRIQISVSILSPATTATDFVAGDWTFGNMFDLETDVLPSVTTVTSVQASVTQFLFEICGKNPYTTFVGSFNTSDVCTSGNATGSGDGAKYYRVDNGSSSVPIFGFTNDSFNGIYLPTAGVFGFTKPFAPSGGGELNSSLPLCTSASKGALATVTDANADTPGIAFGGSGPWTITAYCDGTTWRVGIPSNGSSSVGSCTGLGSGGTCALLTGSTNRIGKILLTTGTGPSSFGGVTLTMSASMGPNNLVCNFTPENGSANWVAGATSIGSTITTAAYGFAWNNNVTNLSATSTYVIAYSCQGY